MDGIVMQTVQRNGVMGRVRQRTTAKEEITKTTNVDEMVPSRHYYNRASVLETPH